MIPIADAVHSCRYKKVIAVMGSQMSKTETMTNLIGHRLDDDPAPQLYIAPTRNFCESVFEPRFKAMVNSCQSLRKKRRPGVREKKTQKHINGVRFRLAWAGSTSELAGDPAATVYVDERDRMDNDIGGEGDPVELADARHSTYSDGQTVIMSTPLEGNVETEEINGLEFWKVSDEVQSPTWKLFQESIRFHWAVPCPDCGDYFIPRFKQLWWPEGASPDVARDAAAMVCPNCASLIDQRHKDQMHAAGVFVAPGQTVDKSGHVDSAHVDGNLPATNAAGFWVSGLMSPWKTWGERAEQWLKAVASNEPERIQTVINTAFGELYASAGEVMEVETVSTLRMPYKLGILQDGVRRITAGVDVQQDRLYYSVRGWGLDLESWNLDQGELLGSTDGEQVWIDLGYLLEHHFGGKPIDLMLIDSGYRTQFVYEFCRRYKARAIPTKGRETATAPISRVTLDVNKTGKRKSHGLSLLLLNTDYFKLWLHERFQRDPELPGVWRLAEDTTEEFCESMVSESRVQKASGKAKWVEVRKNKNHYFDCEVNNVAAAYALNMQTHTSEAIKQQEARRAAKADQPSASKDSFRKNRRSRGKGWFNRDD